MIRKKHTYKRFVALIKERGQKKKVVVLQAILVEIPTTCMKTSFMCSRIILLSFMIIWQIPKTTLSMMMWTMKVLCIMDQVLTLNHIKNQSMLQNVYKQTHMIVYIIMCPVVIIF